MALLKQVCSIIVVLIAILFGYIGNILIKLGAFSSIGIDDEIGNKNCEILSDSINDLIGCGLYFWFYSKVYAFRSTVSVKLILYHY